MNTKDIATAVIDELIVHPTQQPLLMTLRPLIEAIAEQVREILEETTTCRERGEAYSCAVCREAVEQ